MPDGVYIPNTVEGAKLDAAKKFQAFLATKEACDIIASKSGASGPFVVDGCTLPADVPPIVSDQQPTSTRARPAWRLSSSRRSRARPSSRSRCRSDPASPTPSTARRSTTRTSRSRPAARPAGLVGSRDSLCIRWRADGVDAADAPSTADNSPDGGGPMTTQATTAGSALAPRPRRSGRMASAYPFAFYLPAAVIYGVFFLLPTITSFYFSSPGGRCSTCSSSASTTSSSSSGNPPSSRASSTRSSTPSSRAARR